MKVLLTTPSLNPPHGGLRILNEWASRLTEWHDVTLFVNNGLTVCHWYDIPSKVRLTNDINAIIRAECVIIGSPHSIHLQKYVHPSAKCFLFLQMLEHLFSPTNRKFKNQCFEFYQSPNPLISISKWNMKFLQHNANRRGETFYVGNGVNFDHFPIKTSKKDKIVLIEGWESGNATKDVAGLAPRVAKRLKTEGYKILAYSQQPLSRHSLVPDEYYRQPSLEQLNLLYSRAKILLKASKYDARSTSPMEAMTKGTPTVRAITQGDDDLIDGFNAVRVPYVESALYSGAKALLEDDSLYDKLSTNCLEHVQKYSWDYWMKEINEILCTKG